MQRYEKIQYLQTFFVLFFKKIYSKHLHPVIVRIIPAVIAMCPHPVIVRIIPAIITMYPHPVIARKGAALTWQSITADF